MMRTFRAATRRWIASLWILILFESPPIAAATHTAAATLAEASPTSQQQSAARGLVGSQGGTIALRDLARVVVPAGAVTRPRTISVRETSLPSNARLPPRTARVGNVYACEPTHIRFARPVAVTLAYDPSLLSSTDDVGAISIYRVLPSGQLSMVGSETGVTDPESASQDLNVEQRTVTVHTSLLSTYTLLVAR